MKTFSGAILGGLLVFACVTWAQGPSAVKSDAVAAIEKRLGGLRAMPDDERAKVTKQLALDIRGLPAGQSKVGLASGLANLSTEGDFGRDTLQEVTTTLATAMKEQPAPSVNGEPAYPYMELAQLSRFEHMSVNLEGPEYEAALKKLDEIEKARAAADFTLSDITGKSWTLSALKGKVVLVSFWATWCPPCRKEMPDLEALYNRFKDKGFVILAISDEDAGKVNPFIAEHKYTYPVLLDPGRTVNDRYKVDGIPKTFIYNRKGQLAAESIDMRTQGQFLQLLAKAGLK